LISPATARLPAEQGALFQKAMELAVDRQFEAERETKDADDGAGYVTAETSRRIACDSSVVPIGG